MTNADASVQHPDAPVGVRAARPDAASGLRRLCWVQPGLTTPVLGDRVVVREAGGTWVGEVVIPGERLLEWPPADILGNLPTIERLALADEWPLDAETAGHRLLVSLALRGDLLKRPI